MMVKRDNQRRNLLAPHVRFGSLADMCAAKCHVRFTHNSDRKRDIKKEDCAQFEGQSVSALPSRVKCRPAPLGQAHRPPRCLDT